MSHQLRKGAWLPRSFTLSTLNYELLLYSTSSSCVPSTAPSSRSRAMCSLYGFPPCIEFDVRHAGISFAEHSRKPPFSLGLQSFLELLLHKIGVPCVSQRVHETDAVSQKQLDKAIVHGMHAVLSADLN